MGMYFDLVKKNKDNIVIEFKRVINDKTLKVSYIINTNLRMDYGLDTTGNLYNAFHTTSKRKFNKRIAEYKQATGRKPRLTGTDNSLGFTRLVYTFV